MVVQASSKGVIYLRFTYTCMTKIFFKLFKKAQSCSSSMISFKRITSLLKYSFSLSTRDALGFAIFDASSAPRLPLRRSLRSAIADLCDSLSRAFISLKI